mmetsp:Transcript_31053/g.58223  ORF Transcript_31053/g.58223 Transcript_31053/m.58223 type:complete len:318 (+) Transcript_31053:30-983(+)
MSFGELEDWYRQNGGDLAPGIHVKDSDLGGRGLFAANPLAARQKVLSLPLEACLSSADASVAELPVNSLFRLTELLCAELEKGEVSRWACWFRSLPDQTGSWPEWREAELLEAQRGPARFFQEAVELARKLPQWYKQLSQILPGSTIAGLDDKASFRRALAILFSRRFGIQCEDAKIAVCVPFGDMINHSATDSSVDVQYDQASGRLAFVASREIAAGEELLICYGEFDNMELCTNHGFTLPNNPLDKVVLDDGSELTSSSQVSVEAVQELQSLLDALPPEDEAGQAKGRSPGCQAISSWRSNYRRLLQGLLSQKGA